MSQNLRNRQGENEGNSGRGTNTGHERNSYDSFEGMNYEQVRQPYPSQENDSGEQNDGNSAGQQQSN